MSDTSTPKPGKKISPKSAIGGIVAALLLVFILQNRQEVTINFVTREREFPLWIVLGVTAIIGALLGQLIERYIRKEHKE